MAKKETMDAIETSIDAVEDTIETLERIPKVNLNGTTKRQQVIILTTVAVVSSVVAAGATYGFLKGKFTRKQKAEQVV